MGRKKANTSPATELPLGPALKIFGLCLLLAGIAVGYLWQKRQIYHLGIQYSTKEQQVEQFREQNLRMQKQVAYLRSPPVLERRVHELGLGLVRPRPDQVIVLALPKAPPKPAPDGRRYARKTDWNRAGAP